METCSNCGQQFKNIQGLGAHKSRIHPEAVGIMKTETCTACGKKFSAKYIPVHRRKIHGIYQKPKYPVRVVTASEYHRPDKGTWDGLASIRIIKEFMTFSYKGRVWLAEAQANGE